MNKRDETGDEQEREEEEEEEEEAVMLGLSFRPKMKECVPPASVWVTPHLTSLFPFPFKLFISF